MSEAPIARTIQLAPVDEYERVFTLDALRGVAVLGIFIVNILFMAFTVNEAQDWSWQDLSPADGAARVFITFFAEMKFITLFSLLFGMGLAIQNQRAEARQRPLGGVYVRRLLVLLAIGLAHGFLLWFGDILTTYALLGFIAYACRNVSTKRLLITATILMLVPVVGVGSCGIAFPEAMIGQQSSWAELAEKARQEEASMPSSAPTTAAASDDSPDVPYSAELRAYSAADFYEWMAREKEIYQTGTWSEIAAHRAVTYLVVMIFVCLLMFSWRCLALFLIGICVVRAGLFLDRPEHAPLYRKLIAVGLAAGVTLQFVTLWTHFVDSREVGVLLLNFFCLYLGSLGISAAYAGAVALACLHDSWRRRLKPFAAVGRMALTNYLMHSIITALLFHSYGLGYFSRLTYWQGLLVVLAVFALQLVLSPLWLRAFRFGPAEWLWRCATYGRREPLRR